MSHWLKTNLSDKNEFWQLISCMVFKKNSLKNEISFETELKALVNWKLFMLMTKSLLILMNIKS